MHQPVSKSEFKTKALELFREVETSGEPIVITDRGHPTIEVRPYREAGREPLELLKGSVTEYLRPDEPVGEEDWEALS
jgi:prevent-host-death family protein